ncbi:MAG TPA: ATP-binding cassette domain-containing protein [Desulfatirhabdiaceae bacterium]|nr:ATP-binding cassette domain-containing protein [Desulfatirhabdiaceae bacterium]
MRIACNNLTYQYPRTDTVIFKNLSCEFSCPGFHALFGQSGVGKTTLAKMLSGDISVSSESITTTDVQTVLYTHNMERLPGWACVGEMIEAVTLPGHKKKLAELIEAFGLTPFLESRFDRLSLGQQNRANLTRYLLQEFDVLIMDETTREKIIGIIKERFSEKCFVYISHNMVEVSRFCDHIVVIRESHRTPQAVAVNGLNDPGMSATAVKGMERIMLEMAHAS